jgi:3-oxoacyl-[acyl-carrier-protein] synthase II
VLGNKVYIIDYELLSPIAIGADKVIDNIRANFCANRAIQRFDTIGIPFKNAAEIIEDFSDLYQSESERIKAICFADRIFELLVGCYHLAAPRMSQLVNLCEPERTGVILGIGADVTQFELFEEEILALLSDDNRAIIELFTALNDTKDRLNSVINPYDVYALFLAKKFNAAAYQKSILTACASSTQALGLAYDSIKSGEVDVVIAGGADSLVNTLATIAFGKLGVIPDDKVDGRCKPFDLNRTGALAGESAGFAILASEAFVEKHQLEKKAQFLGYGNTLDAYKITAPDPEGDSMTNAIQTALASAEITANQIDYINAHGTGTRHNDHLELKCLQRALGEEAFRIPISSTKSRHGHAIAAAGIQELCILLECMKHKTIPGNINLELPCEAEMNLITENQSKEIKYALTNNFAFGGINTVLAIKNEMNELRIKR